MTKVYMTDRITPESLVHIYEAMGISLPGRVAVNISTGEPGGHNFLQPDLIKDLVHRLKGTIVECNTAYEGRRNTTQAHWQTIHDHGFAAIAPCDILDEDGDMAIPVNGGYHLHENYVGSHLADSVDCDCDAHPHDPEMGDIGIFASTDPVSLDQACVDAVYNSLDTGKAALIERMESRHGIHTVEAAHALGLGSRDYDLVKIG